MQQKRLFVILVIIVFVFSSVSSASLEKAEVYNQHGLIKEAKSELIEVLFSSKINNDRAEAYYQLGNIAFHENNISTALETWEKLIEEFPLSSQSKMVVDRIKQLSDIVGDSTDEMVDNTIASSYLKNGDFWSKGKSTIFSIDSSWIPNVEASIKWYDKVIKEYPRTNASRQAYQRKLQTLIGWKEAGKYGSSHGIKSSFSHYLPQLLSTFSSFEIDHPDASTLQAFRYQIAQVYWDAKDWPNTRKWLNLIISQPGANDSFYKDLAERRLNKIEY